MDDGSTGDGDIAVELPRALVGGLRLPADAARAAPALLRQLPGAVVDLRLLLRNLTRLTGRDGELTALLRAHARLAEDRASQLDRESSAGRTHGPRRRTARPSAATKEADRD